MLLKDELKLLLFLRRLAGHLLLHLHDPRNHPNEGPFWEAHGVVTDDYFTVRFHKDGEGMPTLRIQPEYLV
jgi:hypothetical protein